MAADSKHYRHKRAHSRDIPAPPHRPYTPSKKPSVVDEADARPNTQDSPVTCDDPRVQHGQSNDMSFRHSDTMLRNRPRTQSPTITSSTVSHSSLDAGNKLQSRLTLMNVPMHTFRGPVYYGWLWKRGANIKSWKQRFFLLHGSTLTYYAQTCVIVSDQHGTQCLDLPPLGGMRVASAALSDDTAFGLNIYSSTGRKLQIQAGDQEARELWLHVLSQAKGPMIDHSASNMTRFSGNSVDYIRDTSMGIEEYLRLPSEDEMPGNKHGWLQIRSGRIMYAWKHRHIILTNGHLVVCSDPDGGQRPQDQPIAVLSASMRPDAQHGFSVRLEDKRAVHFRAASEAEAVSWIEAFQSI